MLAGRYVYAMQCLWNRLVQIGFTIIAGDHNNCKIGPNKYCYCVIFFTRYLVLFKSKNTETCTTAVGCCVYRRPYLLCSPVNSVVHTTVCGVEPVPATYTRSVGMVGRRTHRHTGTMREEPPHYYYYCCVTVYNTW